MADGAILGRRTAIGQVSHSDGSATVVATLTLPDQEGHYHVVARVAGGNAAKSSKFAMTVLGMIQIDGSATEIGAQSETDNIGASGYSAALSVSGLTVRLEVTAASGVRSVAFLEGFGVEMALTAA